jgi:hypothetical protein
VNGHSVAESLTDCCCKFEALRPLDSMREALESRSSPADPTDWLERPFSDRSASRPVSRVLYGLGALRRRDVAAIHLGRVSPRASCNLPGRRAGNAPRVAPHAVPIRSCSRCGLPCRPCCQGRGGLLPHPFTLAAPSPEGQGGWFAFCGTFPGVAPAGRYPAPYFHGARTFLTRSLSAVAGAAARPAGRAIKAFAEENATEIRQKQDDAPLAVILSQRIQCRPGAAALSSSRSPKPGSYAAPHGLHCSAGWCRKSCHPRAGGPRPDTSSRI